MGGDLRAGRHRRTVPRRGRGGAACERLVLRPRRERLDAGPRARAAGRATARRRLGLDERRPVLVRHGASRLGRRQVVGLRPHPFEARPLRAFAREVRRPRPRPGARAVVVPLRPQRRRRLRRGARAALRRGLGAQARQGVAASARAHAARTAIPFGAMSELSHVDDAGEVRMVDVGGKPLSRRRAVARAVVRVAPETASQLSALPKGDALATAKLAGIMAAKRTSDLIPLCHPLPLTHVAVEIEVRVEEVEITASAETTAQTGVEMEALVAASVAALTIYDMAKAIDQAMEIGEVRLLEKTKS